LKLVCFTKYTQLGASSRYRTIQYVPSFESIAKVVVLPLFDDEYLTRKYSGSFLRYFDAIKSLFRRLVNVLTVAPNSTVLIEYELFPYLPAIFEHWLGLRGCRVIVDYDDALFHQYDQHPRKLVRVFLGNKIATVMRFADLVVVGNRYLAKYAEGAGARRVEILPTVIDLDRYRLLKYGCIDVGDKCDRGDFVIGWIGSPSTAKYLRLIAPALAELCKATNVRIRLVGAGDIDLPGVSVEIVAWKDDTEVDEIRRFDVGIMPLPNDPWARGKCGFKLIQYMACGLPVVASPVGVNAEIVSDEVNGFLATTTQDWVRALLRLKDDRALRQRMGQEGRKLVEEKYCLEVTAPSWVSLIQELQKPN
jgi:glycosyltransferase involved in cell wall biosynthesis